MGWPKHAARACTVVATLAGAAAAYGDPAVTSTVPATFSAVNPCVPEPVVGTAKLHMTSHTESNGNRLNATMTLDEVAVDAVGSVTGAIYSGVDRQSTTDNASTTGGSATMTFTKQIVLSSRTATVPNFVSHITIHVTVSATGETSADVTNGFSECRG